MWGGVPPAVGAMGGGCRSGEEENASMQVGPPPPPFHSKTERFRMQDGRGKATQGAWQRQRRHSEASYLCPSPRHPQSPQQTSQSLINGCNKKFFPLPHHQLY